MENKAIYQGEELDILSHIEDPAIRKQLDEICAQMLKETSLETLDEIYAKGLRSFGVIDISAMDNVLEATAIMLLVKLRANAKLLLGDIQIPDNDAETTTNA